MKLIPILFSTPMVQGILSENKSMTRRTKGLELASIYASSCKRFDAGAFLFSDKHSDAISLKRCPYGQPGDVLWVRENFNITDPDDAIDGEFIGEETGYVGSVNGKEVRWRFVYKASSPEKHPVKGNCKWKPSIHMPFEACRIFLRVKENRVERLHDISEEDAKREGVRRFISDNRKFIHYCPKLFYSKEDLREGCPYAKNAIHSFNTLWMSINGADSWNYNPWVWVIAFERITDENEIAAIRKQWNERRQK